MYRPQTLNVAMSFDTQTVKSTLRTNKPGWATAGTAMTGTASSAGPTSAVDGLVVSFGSVRHGKTRTVSQKRMI